MKFICFIPALAYYCNYLLNTSIIIAILLLICFKPALLLQFICFNLVSSLRFICFISIIISIYFLGFSISLPLQFICFTPAFLVITAYSFVLSKVRLLGFSNLEMVECYKRFGPVEKWAGLNNPLRLDTHPFIINRPTVHVYFLREIGLFGRRISQSLPHPRGSTGSLFSTLSVNWRKILKCHFRV